MLRAKTHLVRPVGGAQQTDAVTVLAVKRQTKHIPAGGGGATRLIVSIKNALAFVNHYEANSSAVHTRDGCKAMRQR